MNIRSNTGTPYGRAETFRLTDTNKSHSNIKNPSRLQKLKLPPDNQAICGILIKMSAPDNCLVTFFASGPKTVCDPYNFPKRESELLYGHPTQSHSRTKPPYRAAGPLLIRWPVLFQDATPPDISRQGYRG